MTCSNTIRKYLGAGYSKTTELVCGLELEHEGDHYDLTFNWSWKRGAGGDRHRTEQPEVNRLFGWGII